MFGAPIPGYVEAWGSIPFGQLTPPAGLNDAIAVAAGASHSLALRSNGTVVAWGRETQGETIVPPGLSNVVAISARSHNVALKGDGSILVWGHPDPAVTNVPTEITPAIAVAAGNIVGGSYTLAVRSNGTVLAWGTPSLESVTNVPPDLSNVVQVAAGNYHALALKSDSTVAAWGYNFEGQAAPPPGLSNVVAVRAGQSSSFAIKSDGTIVGWGAAVVPPGLTGIVDLQDGANHTIALRTNGEVIAWGSNSAGQATVPAGLSDVGAIAAGVNHNLALTPWPPLVITAQPQSSTRYRGESVTISVAAGGIEPFTYQWRKDETSIPGATTAMLTLTSLRTTNAGRYDAVIVDARNRTVTSLAATLAVLDPTLSYSATLTPSNDTSIYTEGTKPQGDTTLIVGRRRNGIIDRALLRFDLGSIPTNATVDSARLQLTVVRLPLAPASSDFSLYRMLRSWTTDASWTSATADAPWVVPGVGPATDCAATASAARFVTAGGPYVFGPSSQLTADVVSWVTNPAGNHGWLVKCENETSPGTARHFGSSESPQAPRLFIDYSVPAPSPVLTNPQLNGNSFTFQFNAAAGWIYRVESQAELSGSWTTITNAEAGAATNSILIAVPRAPSRQFYRVLAE